MLVSALGYLSYFLIVVFSPLQLVIMLHGRSVNLGVWPLVSLTLGLFLLQASFFWVSVPTYVIVGNLTSACFTAINLAYVSLKRGDNDA